MFLVKKTGLAKVILIIKTWEKSLKVRISSIVYIFIIFIIFFDRSLILSINKSNGDIDKENFPPMPPPVNRKNSRSSLIDGTL